MNNIEDFIAYILSFDLNLEITQGKYLYGVGGRASGYFDSDDSTIKVAGGKSIKKWLPVLVHEFCHYQQMIEKYPLFFSKINGEDAYDLFYSWLQFEKEYDYEIVKESIQKIILVEKDCEMRSVKLINRFNLPINIPRYIQDSNVYLYQHYLALDYRKWIIDIPDRKKIEISKKMPEHFKNKHHLRIPKEIYSTIETGYGYNN